eukprot:9499366-Pyramimonas_sp.AAC.1
MPAPIINTGYDLSSASNPARPLPDLCDPGAAWRLLHARTAKIMDSRGFCSHDQVTGRSRGFARPLLTRLGPPAGNWERTFGAR